MLAKELRPVLPSRSQVDNKPLAVPIVSIKPSPAQPIPQGAEKQTWLRWLWGVCGDPWMWCVNAAIHLPIACCPAAKHRDE